LSLDEAAEYEQALVARLDALLGPDLVGVYAGGSLALGGYAPGRSDIDMAVVSRRLLARARKEEIVAALRHEALPCPARGLELVLYPESVVRVPTDEAGFELDLNTGARMPFHVAFDPSEASRHWYVIDRAILSEHGKRLAGPPAQELFARIPRQTILPILVESIRWHEPPGAARDDDAVLNACRAWRFEAESTWSGKPEAGAWAAKQLDDPALIEAALAARAQDSSLPRREVESFLRGVARRIEEGSRA
jgi:predicted nucleotidyltransferase